MAFPGSPTDGQQHVEGSKNYIYNAAGAVWLVDDLTGSGAANITIVESPTNVDVQSSSGTNDTIALVDGTNAGVMAPGDKTKLDAIEAGATADQTAAEVVVTPTGNLGSIDVQAALQELQGDVDSLQGDVDSLNTINATDYIAGADAPAGGDGIDGQFYLNVTTGDVYGPKTGGSWGASVGNAYDQLGLADSTASDTLAGVAGVATTAARSDHRHAQSRGATLPATDGTAGIEHVLVSHASLPDGKYVLIGTVWVQV